MKVTCEYCGSYVEADENDNCPRCQAPLGDAIRAEEERLRQEAEAARQQEAQEQAEKAEREQLSSALQGIAGIASSLLMGGTRARHPDRMAPPHEVPRHHGMGGEPPRDAHGHGRRPPQGPGRR